MTPSPADDRRRAGTLGVVGDWNRATPPAAPQTWRALVAVLLSAAGFFTILVGGAIDEVVPAIADVFDAPAPPTFAGHVPAFWVSYVVAWLLLNGAFLVFARGLRTPRLDSVPFQLLGALFVFVSGMALYAATRSWGLASALVGLGPGMLFATFLALRNQNAPSRLASAGSR